MAKPLVARVAIESVIPQLDRLFDYAIPEGLEAPIGCRVEVPFGNAKKATIGFVVEHADSSDLENLSAISNVLSAAPVLQPQIYALCREIADRQVVSVAEVLRLAVPKRSVAVEKKWLANATPVTFSNVSTEANRTARIVNPRIVSGMPQWCSEIMKLILDDLTVGRSSVVVVPDFRDQEILTKHIIADTRFADKVILFDTQQTGSIRYAAFLRCISEENAVVVGNRAALYAPVNNLGSLIIWDDGDSSHQEQSSPYVHARDVALIRQRQSNCNIHFLNHARSAEVQRLIELKYLSEASFQFLPPRLSISNSDVRIDGGAWSTVRTALEHGPVLIQVLNKGQASTVYCSSCFERAACKACGGPLWLDAQSTPKCRWCNAHNLNFRCSSCQGQQLKQGRAGSTRTASDFGRAFPGVQIIESTAEQKNVTIKRSHAIVIATPGAEPQVDGGYSAVVILDAARMLARDSLRAEEDAVRSWSNAIASLSESGTAVVVGLEGALAKKLQSWDQIGIAATALAERRTLRFPPAVRIASLSAEPALLAELSEELKLLSDIEILGPVPVLQTGREVESKLIVRFEYSRGAELSAALKGISMRLSAGQSRFNPKSGRAMRPIRIKMDDPEVI